MRVLPCAALLAWIAISKGRRWRQNMGEVEVPPNLMSWGMVVVMGGAAERQRNELHFALFCSFNLNS
jgi:hypothetical protein